MALASLASSSFDIAPSPHRRINAASLLLAFAHMHGEAETPTLAIWSAMVGRNGPFLCEEGVNLFPCKMALASLASSSFDIAPSPHRRINAPSLLLAFAHMHGEAETPTLAIWSAMVGRNGPFLCEEGVNFHAKWH
jgi:hypothetical protein